MAASKDLASKFKFGPAGSVCRCKEQKRGNMVVELTITIQYLTLTLKTHSTAVVTTND